MHEKWEMDDVDKLDNIMIAYSVGMDQYVLQGLDDWPEGGSIYSQF